MADTSMFSELFAVGGSEAGPSTLAASTPGSTQPPVVVPEIGSMAEQLISGMGDINITEDELAGGGSSGDGKGKDVVKPSDFGL